MINNKTKNDMTLSRNYIARMESVIEDYELIKAHKHPNYRYVNEYFKIQKICKKTFLKYYNRYKEEREPSALLPQKRGPLYKTRRPDLVIEDAVVELRRNGFNRFEIFGTLQTTYAEKTPSLSGIYNIFKRHNLNIMNPEMKEAIKRYVKDKIGELGHSDTYKLRPNLIKNNRKQYYLFAVLDDCSRIAWCDILNDLSSVSGMFGIITCMGWLAHLYGIRFMKLLTDNGTEYGGKPTKNIEKLKQENPFRRWLWFMQVEHKQIRPYRPQTNGKVERLWRTINTEFLEGSEFQSVEELKFELEKYMMYYNELRVHQGIEGKTPSTIACEQGTNSNI